MKVKDYTADYDKVLKFITEVNKDIRKQKPEDESYRMKKIPGKVIKISKKLLTNFILKNIKELPYFSPTYRGSIQIEYRTSMEYLEIELFKRYSILTEKIDEKIFVEKIYYKNQFIDYITYKFKNFKKEHRGGK